MGTEQVDNKAKLVCVYCYGAIDVDSPGWGYSRDKIVTQYWHSECVQMHEGIEVPS